MSRNAMNAIELRPIGTVHSAESSTDKMSLQGCCAVIEIFPEYAAAIGRIDENSHLWVLCWFHEARRDVLATSPKRVNPDLPTYGVFSLRTPSRPNPIALSLVRLDKVVGNRLFVSGLDAVNGTAVLDIKPYYEHDIVFSPRTPEILPLDRQMRKKALEKEAFLHHRESCAGLRIAVRMAQVVQDRWGKLNDDELYVEVTGSACLADVIQGLTRARIANPPRFCFQPSGEIQRSAWRKNDKVISLTLLGDGNLGSMDALPDDELFRIEMS